MTGQHYSHKSNTKFGVERGKTDPTPDLIKRSTAVAASTGVCNSLWSDSYHAYAAYRALMTFTGCGLFSPSWKGLQQSPYGLPEKQGQGAEAAGVLFVFIFAILLSLFFLDAGLLLLLSAPKPLASRTGPCCLQQPQFSSTMHHAAMLHHATIFYY